MDSTISLTLPIDNEAAPTALESDLATAFKSIFEDQLGDQIRDILDYGCPHIGSATVVERFSKMDGLLVLRRQATSDTIMRIIYANWLSSGTKRGLNFLSFVLKMIWGDDWEITRLYHSIAYAEKYPKFLYFEKKDNTFLTSRIFLTISENIDLSEVTELVPMLRRLVPANIVPKVTSKALDVNVENSIGITGGGLAYNVMDIS